MNTRVFEGAVTPSAAPSTLGIANLAAAESQLAPSVLPVAGADFSIDAHPVRTLSGTYWLSGQQLAKPIKVHVRGKHGLSLIVSEPKTGIFGAGDDLSSAITDFRSALADHRDALEATERPSADQQEHLELLQNYLRPPE